MSKMEVEHKKSGIKVSVDYGFAQNLDEAVRMYGEEVVLDRMNRQINTELRNRVSKAAQLAKTKKANPQAAAEAACATFAPSVTSDANRAAKGLEKLLDGLSPEVRAQVLAGASTSDSPDSPVE